MYHQAGNQSADGYSVDPIPANQKYAERQIRDTFSNRPYGDLLMLFDTEGNRSTGTIRKRKQIRNAKNNQNCSRAVRILGSDPKANEAWPTE